MLFTLVLLFLLTPVPSIQTTTNEKRVAAGNNVTKGNATFTLSKPKTTAPPSKHSLNSNLNPNTATVTILPTAVSNQKSTTANPATTTKGKPSVTVVETTHHPPAAKATKATGINTNRDKQKVNQTGTTKLQSSSEDKSSRDKPGPTGALKDQSTITKNSQSSTLKTLKNIPQQADNQTMLAKSPSTGDEKNGRDKASHNAHSIPSSGSKTTKDKATPSGNRIGLNIPLTNSEEKSKDKSTANIPFIPASGKSAQDNATPSGNQTITHTYLLKSDEKSKDKSTPSVLSLPTNSTKTTKDKHKAFGNHTVVDTHHQSNDEKTKDKPGERVGGFNTDKEIGPTAVAHTPSIKATSKDNVASSQPINVLIINNDNSSHTKEQLLTLKPGAPLVMTHRINLLPGGCTGGCETEMAALKGRLTRLEREMSLLKEKCPCSANCPNDCSGNGKCEKGKCVCHKGFTGLDCSKCSKDAECGREDDKKKGSAETDTTMKVTLNSTNMNLKEDSPHSNKDNETLKEALGQKPETTKISPTVDPKQGTIRRSSPPLKDEPQLNLTLSNERKTNSTSKIKSPDKKNSVERPTLTNKNVNTKQIKPEKPEKKNQLSNDIRKPLTTPSSKDNPKVHENKTAIDHSSKKHGGLGSVKAVNISSSSFTITWLAPHRMFKNFTVIRRELRADSDKDDTEGLGEEIVERHSVSGTRNSTEVQSETTNTTLSSGKHSEPKRKTDTKRISRVVPGRARSFEFSNLKANTRYVVQVFGSTADRRSKIHRVTATTGPDPPTELVFSNVTESSITVSWTKPKTIFTGFKVTYINIATGKSQFVTVDPHQSNVVLSTLSAGSSYIISVITTKGRAQSDELTSVITTVPAPPTHLQVINVTDNRAMLRWTPSLGKVDRFIVSYESSKSPNVTVTVMLSGNSVQYQLKGLQRDTLYKIKVRTQKNNLQSMGISTTFTTASVVKASEISARSAVITWRTSAVYHSYRLIYQAAKEDPKEVILEPTITEYKLTGLMPSLSYFVVVQGEKNGKYTSLVTSQFITGKLRFPFPTECSQELLNGALESGEVNIYPQGKVGQAVRVYCDMETDGGGWTVFQRRMNGKTDFYRTWSEYKTGFGNLSEEFWLGNELLHNLTSIGPVSLRVDLRSGNDTAYARYTNFSVASEERNYTLTVSGYTGTAGDSMRYHNGRPFSTRDKEPDPLGIHCAKAYVGGWWYKNCYKVNLNGLYGMNSDNKGIVWIDWKGKDSSIPFSEMKFRPSRFSPSTHG